MLAGVAESTVEPIAVMAMCARTFWRQDLDTGRALLTTHSAANKVIMATDEGLALCSPVSFAADFAAAKIFALRELAPSATVKNRRKGHRTLS